MKTIEYLAAALVLGAASCASRQFTLYDIITMDRNGKPPIYERVHTLQANPLANRLTYAQLERKDAEQQMMAVAKKAPFEEAWAYFPKSRRCQEVGIATSTMESTKGIRGIAVLIDMPELRRYIKEHPEEGEVTIYHIHPISFMNRLIEQDSDTIARFISSPPTERKRAVNDYMEMFHRMPSTGDLEAHVVSMINVQQEKPGMKVSSCVATEFGIVELKLTQTAEKEYRTRSFSDAVEMVRPVATRYGGDCEHIVAALSRAGVDTKTGMKVLTRGLTGLSGNFDGNGTRVFVYQSR